MKSKKLTKKEFKVWVDSTWAGVVGGLVSGGFFYVYSSLEKFNQISKSIISIIFSLLIFVVIVGITKKYFVKK